MPKTLIVGEIQGGALREATLELVTLARGLGWEISSLVIGSGVGAQAEELAKKGGGKVLVADDASRWRNPIPLVEFKTRPMPRLVSYAALISRQLLSICP